MQAMSGVARLLWSSLPRSVGGTGWGSRARGRARDGWSGAVLLGAALALPVPAPVWAQADAPAPQAAPALSAQDDRRYAEDLLRRERNLSSEIMSPFCPGRTLINCTSDQARSYREVFKRYLAEGVSEQELKAQFEAQWGAAARSTPRSAFGWLLPGLILGAGAALLAFALIRLRSGREPAAPERVAVDRDLESELERELRSRGL
jgi:cytochrome c-type biogenesis protein CcmH/NrfF